MCEARGRARQIGIFPRVSWATTRIIGRVSKSVKYVLREVKPPAGGSAENLLRTVVARFSPETCSGISLVRFPATAVLPGDQKVVIQSMALFTLYNVQFIRQDDCIRDFAG